MTIFQPAAYLTNVAIVPADGYVRHGDTVQFRCYFSDRVVVDGDPVLTTTNRDAFLSSDVSVPSDVLVFESQIDVRYKGTSKRAEPVSFNITNGSIKDIGGNAVGLDIQHTKSGPWIETVPTSVARVIWPLVTGGAKSGDTILFDVQFSDNVQVSGVPSITLTSGGTATYVSGSGTNVLRFKYDVGANDAVRHLGIAAQPIKEQLWAVLDDRGYSVSLALTAGVAMPLITILKAVVEPPPVEPPPVEPPPVEPPPVEPPPVEPPPVEPPPVEPPPVEPPPVEPPPVEPPPISTVVVRAAVQNPTADVSPSRIDSFGHVFSAGEMTPAGALLTASGGMVQMDPKTYWPDGSISHAILTLRRPECAAGATVPIELQKTAAYDHPTVAVPSAASRTLPTIIFTNLTGPGASISPTISIADLVDASDKTDVWRTGPWATEIRVEQRVCGSLRIIADVTFHSDQTWTVDIQVANDIAMEAVGGTYTYDMTIAWGDTATPSTWQSGPLTHVQYQAWHYETDSRGTSEAFIDPDRAGVMASGAVLPFVTGPEMAIARNSLTNGIISDPTFGKPLAANGVMKLMGTTGGRLDIGPVTAPVNAWLSSGDPLSRRMALTWGDTSGAVPWRMWDTAHAEWLSVDAYPAMWMDQRSAVKPTQFSDSAGWSIDPAHEPDLAYVPYLLTGKRFYLDQTNAQAAYTVIALWNSPRQDGKGLIINGFSQVRACAWGVRQLDRAAFINPEGKFRTYFRKLSANNWNEVSVRADKWKANEGEAFGRVPGDYAKNDIFAPWQQDYLATTAVQAIMFGLPGAREALTWMKNFLIGRFYAEDKGFSKFDSITYNVVQAPGPTGTADTATDLYKTWAEMGAAMVATGRSNDATWSKKDNAIAFTAYAALVAMTWVDDDPQIRDALAWLISVNPPGISPTEPRVSLGFNIRPKPLT